MEKNGERLLSNGENKSELVKTITNYYKSKSIREMTEISSVT